jgi:hypothetical protein
MVILATLKDPCSNQPWLSIRVCSIMVMLDGRIIPCAASHTLMLLIRPLNPRRAKPNGEPCWSFFG